MTFKTEKQLEAAEARLKKKKADFYGRQRKLDTRVKIIEVHLPNYLEFLAEESKDENQTKLVMQLFEGAAKKLATRDVEFLISEFEKRIEVLSDKPEDLKAAKSAKVKKMRVEIFRKILNERTQKQGVKIEEV